MALWQRFGVIETLHRVVNQLITVELIFPGFNDLTFTFC